MESHLAMQPMYVANVKCIAKICQQFIQFTILHAVNAVVNENKYAHMVLICVETNWPGN